MLTKICCEAATRQHRMGTLRNLGFICFLRPIASFSGLNNTHDDILYSSPWKLVSFQYRSLPTRVHHRRKQSILGDGLHDSIRLPLVCSGGASRAKTRPDSRERSRWRRRLYRPWSSSDRRGKRHAERPPYASIQQRQRVGKRPFPISPTSSRRSKTQSRKWMEETAQNKTKRFQGSRNESHTITHHDEGWRCGARGDRTIHKNLRVRS